MFDNAAIPHDFCSLFFSLFPFLFLFFSFSPAGAGEPDWRLSAAEQNKFSQTFASIRLGDGKALGSSVKSMLSKTGLPPASISRIFSMADLDQDGRMTQGI